MMCRLDLKISGIGRLEEGHVSGGFGYARRIDMGLRISTNVASINAQRNLGNSQHALANSQARLSSGFRINKAADDAAGLAISEHLKAEIRGLRQASRNANDGISLVQTAEGGLQEASNILIRFRELAIEAASDTIGNKERGFLDVDDQK